MDPKVRTNSEWSETTMILETAVASICTALAAGFATYKASEIHNTKIRRNDALAQFVSALYGCQKQAQLLKAAKDYSEYEMLKRDLFSSTIELNRCSNNPYLREYAEIGKYTKECMIAYPKSKQGLC